MKQYFIRQKQRGLTLLVSLGFVLTVFYLLGKDPDRELYIKYFGNTEILPRRTRWTNHTQRNPIDPETYLLPPVGKLARIPKIQRKPTRETAAQKRVRLERLEAVRAAFVHTWEGYAGQAWMHDEVHPLAGSYQDNFGGWGSTLIDSLDTLWMMGFKEEFAYSVNAIKDLDLSETSRQISVFETTIRFLGGLLAAYDVSGARFPILLHKAVELADFLYMAFDTQTRMPVQNLHAER